MYLLGFRNNEVIKRQSIAANSKDKVPPENIQRRHGSAKINVTRRSEKNEKFSHTDDHSQSNSTTKVNNRTIFDPVDGKIVYYDSSAKNYKFGLHKRNDRKSSWRQVAGKLPLTPKGNKSFYPDYSLSY